MPTEVSYETFTGAVVGVDVGGGVGVVMLELPPPWPPFTANFLRAISEAGSAPPLPHALSTAVEATTKDTVEMSLSGRGPDAKIGISLPPGSWWLGLHSLAVTRACFALPSVEEGSTEF